MQYSTLILIDVLDPISLQEPSLCLQNLMLLFHLVVFDLVVEVLVKLYSLC